MTFEVARISAIIKYKLMKGLVTNIYLTFQLTHTEGHYSAKLGPWTK
jgi:hypothetical protein